MFKDKMESTSKKAFLRVLSIEKIFHNLFLIIPHFK